MKPDYLYIRQLERELDMPLSPMPEVAPASRVVSSAAMVARRQDSWDRIERDAKRLAALGTMLALIIAVGLIIGFSILAPPPP